MSYSDFGLVNTKKILLNALRGGYAVPAFNFFNIESLIAITKAAEITQSPVILAVSESALEYMDGFLMGMIKNIKLKRGQVALHLDHGHSFESCKHAIDLGFSSVMFDGSKLSLEENIKISKKVVDYAHKHNVTVETELGTIGGKEDSKTKSKNILYTDPDIVKDFVKQTGTDSLAIAIGTSHGAYKRKSDKEKLRLDILKQIAENIPTTPLVLHGASTIPQKFVKNINKFGGDIKNAKGITPSQLRQAIKLNITKINIDSDSRLAFTSAIRENLYKDKTDFDPRKYLTKAIESMTQNCIDEIQNIMGSGYKI